MTGCVDDQETRKPVNSISALQDLINNNLSRVCYAYGFDGWLSSYPFNDPALFFDVLDWDICGTDLLGDTTGLAILHVCPTKFIEDLCLSSIDVPQDTDDRRSKIISCALLLSRVPTFLKLV